MFMKCGGLEHPKTSAHSWRNDVDFTFGIITNGEEKDRVDKIIESIICQNVPKFQIVIVGGENEWGDIKQVNHYPFDETIKNGWITAKKNMITAYAKYENVVYMHDYFILDDDWYQGFLDFGDDWDVCMNKITGSDGERYIDWISIGDVELAKSGYRDGALVPYDYDKTEAMYVSGGYWVAKRDFMIENPLDERICWGFAEDCEWSYRINKIKKCKYRMNANSSCSIIKEGKTAKGRHDGTNSSGVRWAPCTTHEVYNGTDPLMPDDESRPMLSHEDDWPYLWSEISECFGPESDSYTTVGRPFKHLYEMRGEPECNYLKLALEENAE